MELSHKLGLAQKFYSLGDMGMAFQSLIDAVYDLEEENEVLKSRISKLEPVPRTGVPYLGDREL